MKGSIWYYLGMKDYPTLMYDKFYEKEKFKADYKMNPQDVEYFYDKMHRAYKPKEVINFRDGKVTLFEHSDPR